MPTYTSQQQEAMRELLKRKGTFTPERAGAVDELARRMGIADQPANAGGVGISIGAGGSWGHGYGAGTSTDLPPGYTEGDLANPGPTTAGGVAAQNLHSFEDRVIGGVKGLATGIKNTAKNVLGMGAPRPPLLATPDEMRAWGQKNARYHQDNPDLVDMVVDPSLEQLHKAGEAEKRGDTIASYGHVLGATPLVGPLIAQTYEDAKRGDVGSVVGNLALATQPEIARRVKGRITAPSPAMETTFSGAGAVERPVGSIPGIPSRAGTSATGAGESPYGGATVEPDLSRIPSTATRIRSRVLNSSLARGAGKPIIQEAIAAGKDPGLVYNENFPKGHVRPDVREAAVDARLTEIHKAAQDYLTNTPEIATNRVSTADVMRALSDPLEQANAATREAGVLSGSAPSEMNLSTTQQAFTRMLTDKYGSTELTPAQLNDLTRSIYDHIKRFKPLSSADQSSTAVWQRQARNLRNLTESASTLADGTNPLRQFNHDYASLAAVSEAAGKAVAEGQTAPVMPRSVMFAGAAGGVGHYFGHPILAAIGGGIAGGVYDIMNSPAIAARVGRLMRRVVPAEEQGGLVRPPSDVPFTPAPARGTNLPPSFWPSRETPIPVTQAGQALFDPRTGITGEVTPDLTPSMASQPWPKPKRGGGNGGSGSGSGSSSVPSRPQVSTQVPTAQAPAARASSQPAQAGQSGRLLRLSPDELRTMEVEHRRQIAAEEAQMERERAERGAPPMERHLDRLSEPVPPVSSIPSRQAPATTPVAAPVAAPIPIPTRARPATVSTTVPSPSFPVVPENPLFADRTKKYAPTSPVVNRAVVDDRVRRMTVQEQQGKPEVKQPISARARATITGAEGSAARLRREAEARKSGATVKAPAPATAPVPATASASSLSPSPSPPGPDVIKVGSKIKWTGPQGVERSGTITADGGVDMLTRQRGWEVRPDHAPNTTTVVKEKNIIAKQASTRSTRTGPGGYPYAEDKRNDETEFGTTHENEALVANTPLWQLLPERFKTARSASGSSPAAGMMPGRKGTYGYSIEPNPHVMRSQTIGDRMVDMPISEYDRTNKWDDEHELIEESGPGKPRMGTVARGKGRVFNNVQTARDAGDFVALHELGHAVYEKDLTDAERLAWRKIHDKYAQPLLDLRQWREREREKFIAKTGKGREPSSYYDDPDDLVEAWADFQYDYERKEAQLEARAPRAIVKYSSGGDWHSFTSLMASALLDPTALKKKYSDVYQYMKSLGIDGKVIKR